MSGSLQAPALSPERARFWNALVSRLLPATLRLDNGQDQAVSVTLSCPVDSLQPREIASSYTCYVNCNGLWQVDFDNLELLRLRPELAAWHDADRENRFALLPEGLVRAVFERLFLSVLDTISRVTGLPALFVGSPRPATRPRFTESLDFFLRTDGKQPSTCMMRLAWQDTSTLLPVLERLEALPLLRPRLPNELLTRLQITAALEIGQMRLTSSELASLERGDILLPTLLTPEQPCVRLAQGIRLRARLDQCTLTLEDQQTPSTLSQGDKTMSDTADSSAQHVQQSSAANEPLLKQDDLGKLELEITFALPSIKLPLTECARLAAGTTFTLAADAAHLPVTVLAQGRPVAMGRLVDVGGTLGVQLTQLASTEVSESSMGKAE